MADGFKKKGRELAVLLSFGCVLDVRDATYAEYLRLVLCRDVIESRRAWTVAIGNKLKDSSPKESFFLGLLDEEDEEEAGMLAARMANDLMMANAMANKGR
jgi:hypothetical protein